MGPVKLHQTSLVGFKRQIGDIHITTDTALKIPAFSQTTVATDIHTFITFMLDNYGFQGATTTVKHEEPFLFGIRIVDSTIYFV